MKTIADVKRGDEVLLSSDWSRRVQPRVVMVTRAWRERVYVQRGRCTLAFDRATGLSLDADGARILTREQFALETRADAAETELLRHGIRFSRGQRPSPDRIIAVRDAVAAIFGGAS